MRVNVYAEEMTDIVEIIEKKSDAGEFTGVRFILHLPVTVPSGSGMAIHRGPFFHKPGDDDSSAVTFWGNKDKDLRVILRKALEFLDQHFKEKGNI